MKVEITVKIEGKKVARHVEQVGGTLEEMEEKIHALSKTLAGETLQASVEAYRPPHPFFRQPDPSRGTKDTRNEPSSV